MVTLREEAIMRAYADDYAKAYNSHRTDRSLKAKALLVEYVMGALRMGAQPWKGV